MAEFFKLEIDLRELERQFTFLPDVTKKATVNSLNKVGRLANTGAKKDITSNYNIKASSLKIGSVVNLKRADARRGIPVFTIIVRKVARGLLKYGAVQGARGVTVKVRKSPKTIRSSFISTWKRGQSNKFVFIRDPKLGTVIRKRKGRQYIAQKRRQLFGPSIAALYNSRRVRREIDSVIDKNYQSLLNEEFNRQFEKKR
jgi:hypothetical protein